MACASACTAGGWFSPGITTAAPRCAWRSLTNAATNFRCSGFAEAPPPTPNPAAMARASCSPSEARHLFFQIGIASGRKRPGIVKESGEPAGKEIAIEGQNDVGLFQVVTRLHILPERQLRPSSNVVTV